MGIKFFDNQKVDYIGELSVELQYFTIIMFVLLTIDLIFLILLAALALGFILPLPFTALIWICMPFGFLGCWRRNHIIVLIFVCAGGLAMFLLMLGMAILVLLVADVATACGVDNDCDVGHQFIIPTVLVYVIVAICFLLGGIVLGIGIRTWTRFWKLRQKIVRSARGDPTAKKEKKEKKKKPEKDDDEEDFY
mmetsp:Transcript_22059/g.86749  ORF Transcript_22059/g.86749 Transcript_22059/m.86749 type:complete len:193 (+) Transcript_22059:274-852(+)|eukprot:CAMPEP_0114617946 /NCGR_PEP_ID=MMETSP0168-20121206/7456_1 /TAXON_ID=95228 ORGANISM="Vannella sp., Strain DIVA3 517/6/12" /NCGR_SAMPLE_ID=MMETSP0168 /ASSEMBLY_ACC=CAM_ASM_000044 /LENGTH=192 /DNA_ID=CAMNT_0001829091 /DNA_START=253 /DNA_END=831 /DNA_ORIENTATION=+